MAALYATHSLLLEVSIPPFTFNVWNNSLDGGNLSLDALEGTAECAAFDSTPDVAPSMHH